MKGLIRWFLASPVAANLLMVVLLAGGIATALQITVRTFPEITPNAVTVTVPYPGATPTEVADAVLTPIEEQLQGLEGVRELSSLAARGSGTVTAELTRGADVTEVKDDVETEVAQITTFPDAAERPRVTELERDELAVQLALYGETDLSILKRLAERMREAITDRPGVSRAELVGVPLDRIDIAVPRERLRSYGLGLTELAERIDALDLDLSGGRIDTGLSEIQVRTVGESETAAAFSDVVLFSGETGATVRLSEIADPVDTFAETALSASISGQPAIFISVYRSGTEQVLNVADQVKTYLNEELKPTLPEDIEAVVWRDEAQSLRDRINLLGKNGAIGIALILFILTLFLDLRIAAWVAVGVAVSFIGAFIPMLFFGVTINQLSLFGFILALGIVVDDAIVVGENTYTRLEKSGDSEEAAEKGVLRVWRPILFSVSTTIVAFVPLLFLPGSSGSFIAPIAAVVIFVLVLSLVESFLVLPSHLAHLANREPRRWSPRRVTEAMRKRVDGAFKRFTNGPLCRIVTGSIRHPFFVVATCVAIFLGTIGLFTGGVVKFVFFPDIEGNFVTVELDFPEGTSDQETVARAQTLVEAAQRAAQDVGGDDLLVATAVTVGFNNQGGPDESQGRVFGGSTARVEAKLKDANERQVSALAFQEAWREAAGEVAGVEELVYSSSVVGVGSPIVLEASAQDEATRNEALGRIRQALSERQGVFDIRDDRFSSADEVALSLTEAGRAYGVTLDRLATEVRAAFFGARVAQIARDREEVDVRVRLPEEQRDSVADLYRLRIPTAEGLVPIGLVAEITFQPAPTEIERIDGRTVKTLTADVDTAITTGGAETSYVMNQLVPQLKKDYPSLEVTTGGEQEEAGRFTSSLATNFLMALFGIYAILALAFGSYLRPAIVLLLIPFGLIGAVLGHAMLGLDLTLLSLFGIIGLSGVLVNAALLIVDFILAGEAEGKDPHTAILEATLSRFRPVMMTTLTTFLGISPIILETSVQAQFLIPTAVSLGFGILFVSILQMVLVPAFASIYARGRGALRPEPAAEGGPSGRRPAGA
jgi:multidrug efflux pump subunit AcrB